MNISELINFGSCLLRESKIPSHLLDAELLLSKTLKKLEINEYIEVLHDGDPEGNYKKYIASSKGLSVLPLLMELYLFSCDRFEESLLSPFELNFKKEATRNCTLFKKKIIREYHNFTQEVKIVSVLN